MTGYSEPALAASITYALAQLSGKVCYLYVDPTGDNTEWVAQLDWRGETFKASSESPLGAAQTLLERVDTSIVQKHDAAAKIITELDADMSVLRTIRTSMGTAANAD